MFFAVICFAAVGMVSLLSCSGSAQVPQANLKTNIDSLSYAMGVNITTQGLDQYLMQMEIDSTNKEDLIRGIMESVNIKKGDKKANAYLKGLMMGEQLTGMFTGMNGNIFASDSTQSLDKTQFLAGFFSAMRNKHLLIPKEGIQMFVQTKTIEVQAKANEKVKNENQAFLTDNKTKKGIVTTPSGLQYKVNKESTGIKPAAEDTVLVSYALSDIHGIQIEKNDSVKFNVNKVIPGWTEGIQLMSPGAKYTFYVPYNLGYGEQGNPPRITPYATLVFDVELLKVSPAVAPAVKK
jgi:FKBP-type peptidyl-prolyl cis-trans isomerase FklB